jgi:hypothetical protein
MNDETKLNRNFNRAPNASSDPLDRLLATHFAQGEELAPSSGFTSSVMDTLQAEDNAPPPIQFPWRRVVPGIAAILCAIAIFAVLAMRLWNISGASSPEMEMKTSFAMALPAIPLTSVEQAVVYTVLAAVLSFAIAMGSMRLAGSGRR